LGGEGLRITQRECRAEIGGRMDMRVARTVGMTMVVPMIMPVAGMAMVVMTVMVVTAQF